MTQVNDLYPDGPVPIASQIKCVEREIAMRESVYPRRVDAGKMGVATADREIRAMRAVLKTLQALQSEAADAVRQVFGK